MTMIIIIKINIKRYSRIIFVNITKIQRHRKHEQYLLLSR